MYDADYYKSNNYTDYMDRRARYDRVACEISDLLQKLNLVDKQSLIVDFGCAVGFLLEGLRDFGYNAIGVDISEWARDEALKRGVYIHASPDTVRTNVDMLLALDVFEHMSDNDVTRTITTLSPKVMLVRVPTSTDEGRSYHLEVSRADPTHINCKTKEAWIKMFKSLGYTVCIRLNLYTIYDTPGVTCLLVLR